MDEQQLRERYEELQARKADEAKRRERERELVRMRCELQLQEFADDRDLIVDETVDGLIVGEQLVAVRCPTPKEYTAWLDRVRETKGPKDKAKAQRERIATEQLARQCLLVPSREEFAALCDEFSGVAYHLGDKAATLAQRQTEDLEGKS